MDTTAKNGFTLVELLTIIGIIGIVGCIAVPTLMQVLPNKNLLNTVRNIHSALMLAKSEAGRRNVVVTVVIRPDNEHTYKICVDNGKDPLTNKPVGGDAKPGDGKCHDGEEVLQSGSRLPNRVVFNPGIGSKGTGITFPDQSVSFTPRGIPRTKSVRISESIRDFTATITIFTLLSFITASESHVKPNIFIDES